MMRASDRMAVAVTVAVLLATLTLTPLTSDLAVVSNSWLLVLLLGAVTLGVRRARLGTASVLVVQLVVLLLFTASLVAGLPAFGETWSERVAWLVTGGVEHMQTQAAPMVANPGVQLLFVPAVGGIFVLTDLLAAGLARPAWALAPTATMFLVPAIGVGIDTGLVSFLCVAVGYLGILIADGLNTSARWTRGLSRDSANGLGAPSPVVWRAAGTVGGLALAAAVVLGLALPTLSLPGFGFGPGTGRGGPLQLTDPTLDLKRNLNRPVDSVIMEYRTDSSSGLYLRTASLPEFTGNGWANVGMQLDLGNQLPAIPGLAEEPAERRTTTIEAFDLRSRYLPLPYATRQFDAEGDWAYDPNSLVVIGRGRDSENATQDLTYTAESVDVNPSAQQLADAPAGAPTDAVVTGDVPEDLPDSLRQLTRRVTRGADTPALQAAAIQEFLRSASFTYSTEQRPGSGFEAMENFLLRDRSGYCEQFATSMAMMARVVGIPSRVAIGFLPGDRKAGDVWEVSAHDMHAWPELFFAGYGWVRFEPTPATVTGIAPPWTLPNAEDPTEETAAPTSGPSSAVPTPTTGPTTVRNDPDEDPGAAAGGSWVRPLVTAGGGLLALAVLAAPATVRIRRRTARMAEDGFAPAQVESAWAEIRDTVVDYGGTWPNGSPRAIGGAIASRLEGEDAASMTTVATLVERGRYAATPPEPETTRQLPALIGQIRAALADRHGPGRKVLAVVLPRSVLRRRRRRG